MPDLNQMPVDETKWRVFQITGKRTEWRPLTAPAPGWYVEALRTGLVKGPYRTRGGAVYSVAHKAEMARRFM